MACNHVHAKMFVVEYVPVAGQIDKLYYKVCPTCFRESRYYTTPEAAYKAPLFNPTSPLEYRYFPDLERAE